MLQPDIVLELADLLEYDSSMQSIKVDKSIFDDYDEGTIILIQFVNDLYDDLICTYIMTNEDEEGIFMENID